ncbi:hypothetical protein [Metabacillus fastidiosus]|uniref:hypothetical protein n=1 Tax=Metabacillus fastidiosus TaxID=1458 RepID=UPI003D2C66C8
MNINSFVRSYTAQNLNGEDFLEHVANLIERQLKEWDSVFEVIVKKFANYELIIKTNELSYYVDLSENELNYLQQKDPFALDQKVWEELQNQGLPIINGFGDYMDFVL